MKINTALHELEKTTMREWRVKKLNGRSFVLTLIGRGKEDERYRLKLSSQKSSILWKASIEHEEPDAWVPVWETLEWQPMAGACMLLGIAAGRRGIRI